MKDGKILNSIFTMNKQIITDAAISLRFDPWSLLNGLRNKALELGVTFARAEACGFETQEIYGFTDLADRMYSHHQLKRAHVNAAICFFSY